MDAGRELDAEVAEKVMGWTFTPAGTDGRGHPGPLDAYWSAPAGDPTYNYYGSWNATIVPPAYSTDIADAWQIIERADEVELWNHTGKQFGCRLIFGGREGQSVAKTAPLVLCRAALAALGGKEQGFEVVALNL